MSAGESISPESFRKIRDKALLISVGGAYLCEPPFLARYGREVEHALSDLERDIRNLRERFPGRSSQEVDTEKILGEIRGLAERMKEADPTLRKRCATLVGSALETHLKRLSETTHEVQRQVEGAPDRYSGTEAVAGTFLRAGQAVLGGFGVLGKIAAVVLLAMAVTFGYLFFTMEREGSLEKEIATHIRQIQVLEEEVTGLEEEQIAPLERRIRELEREGAGRSSKVRKLELMVELGELERRAATLRGEIKQHQIAVQEAEASLESLKQKGFFERLVRQ
jgi:hypothetical protein